MIRLKRKMSERSAAGSPEPWKCRVSFQLIDMIRTWPRKIEQSVNWKRSWFATFWASLLTGSDHSFFVRRNIRKKCSTCMHFLASNKAKSSEILISIHIGIHIKWSCKLILININNHWIADLLFSNSLDLFKEKEESKEKNIFFRNDFVFIWGRVGDLILPCLTDKPTN